MIENAINENDLIHKNNLAFYNNLLFSGKSYYKGFSALCFSYYENGKLHRLTGPAIIWQYPHPPSFKKDTSYEQYWYYNNEYIYCNDQNQFEKIIKLKIFK